jgi:uncharacterized damage-inducible protein DinB
MTIEPPELSWPATDAAERAMLEGFLDGYRDVLLRKAAGLDQAQLAATLPPSTMTLGGLLKHMAVVEEGWFTETLLGEPLPEPWISVDWAADRDWEWHTAHDDSPEQLLELFSTSVERSRATAARFDSLDVLAARPDSDGTPFNLRWIYVHMIEEYARHCGHADLIRESIDGATGD